MGRRPIALEFRSRLDAPAEVVWHAATSLSDINDELGPLLRLRGPAGLETIGDLAGHEGTVRAGLWLFGIVPIDRMLVQLETIEAARFVERSRLVSMRTWRHDRRVEPAERGCLLEDRLTLEPRLWGTGWLLRLFVRRLFIHRHRRLRHRYGEL